MGVTETPKKAAHRLASKEIAEGFKPQALHEFQDIDGEPIYWRIRAKHSDGRKWIRPMHFNGNGYQIGEPDFTGGKPLYRLPDIARDLHAAVYVTEGENCADALAKLGLTATTSGAADSAKSADWSPVTGRAVVVWPDNDEAGLRYAMDVSASLEGVASSVSVIDVKALTLPKKGDVVDWIATHPKATAKDIAGLKQVRPMTASPAIRAVTVRMDTVKPEPIRWLWPGRIALGKLTMIAGDPGLGKSLISIAMAGHITRGKPWPVDHSHCPLGDVVMLSAEDDPADTIRPRLDAAGADPTRVYVMTAIRAPDRESGALVNRMVSLKRDLPAVDELLDTLPECNLLVVDPISAYLDGADSHNNSDIRGLLAPLSELAARRRLAVVTISHLNKGGNANAMYRMTGSLAFVAAARAAFLVAKDQENSARRLVLPIKNNLGPDSSGVAYEVTESANGAPTVTWDPDPVTLSAEEALSSEPDEFRTEREEAVDWLKDRLSVGSVSSKQIFRDSKGEGIKDRTLRRAKDELGIKPRKLGFSREWVWELPKMATELEGVHPNTVAILGVGGHLGDADQVQSAREEGTI